MLRIAGQANGRFIRPVSKRIRQCAHLETRRLTAEPEPRGGVVPLRVEVLLKIARGAPSANVAETAEPRLRALRRVEQEVARGQRQENRKQRVDDARENLGDEPSCQTTEAPLRQITAHGDLQSRCLQSLPNCEMLRTEQRVALTKGTLRRAVLVHGMPCSCLG
eukprot:6177000-Pleurochrysis_carterae.AAC.1